MEVLLTPQHNVGKGTYTVNLESSEKLYWSDTESGLLGAFGFEGTCTVGDGSCDPPTRSMGEGFCNFSVMKWNTITPLDVNTISPLDVVPGLQIIVPPLEVLRGDNPHLCLGGTD